MIGSISRNPLDFLQGKPGKPNMNAASLNAEDTATLSLQDGRCTPWFLHQEFSVSHVLPYIFRVTPGLRSKKKHDKTLNRSTSTGCFGTMIYIYICILMGYSWYIHGFCSDRAPVHNQSPHDADGVARRKLRSRIPGEVAGRWPGSQRSSTQQKCQVDAICNSVQRQTYTNNKSLWGK